MRADTVSRRVILALAATPVELALAHQHARQSGRGSKSWRALTAEEAAEIESLAAEIIPADGSPGAREAGVIHFIDYALSTFDKRNLKEYRDGLAMLQQKRRELFPSSVNLAGLSSSERQRLIAPVEKTAFFELLRTHTISGFFGNPEYGGNQGEAGWKLIGFKP